MALVGVLAGIRRRIGLSGNCPWICLTGVVEPLAASLCRGVTCGCVWGIICWEACWKVLGKITFGLFDCLNRDTLFVGNDLVGEDCNKELFGEFTELTELVVVFASPCCSESVVGKSVCCTVYATVPSGCRVGMRTIVGGCFT